MSRPHPCARRQPPRRFAHNRQLAEAAVKFAPEGAEVQLFEGARPTSPSTTRTSTSRAASRPPPRSCARPPPRARRPPALLARVQRHHPGRPEERHRLGWSRPYGAGAFTGKPVAVVGTAFGQYGGVWAQDEGPQGRARIAGGKVIEDIKLAIPARSPASPRPTRPTTPRSPPSSDRGRRQAARPRGRGPRRLTGAPYGYGTGAPPSSGPAVRQATAAAATVRSSSSAAATAARRR